jgi:hypothetical protein
VIANDNDVDVIFLKILQMEKAKARGKQLLEALGVKENSNDGNEAIEGESNGKKGREGAGTPMTMRSLFGKFTRRD